MSVAVALRLAALVAAMSKQPTTLTPGSNGDVGTTPHSVTGGVSSDAGYGAGGGPPPGFMELPEDALARQMHIPSRTDCRHGPQLPDSPLCRGRFSADDCK